MPRSLVILAAGIGSRYGGLKQLDGFGPGGEAIMDFTIHDALAAGFERIICVVRPEVEAVLRPRLMPRLAGRAELAFAEQRMDPPPPAGSSRTKPWGTGQAVLAAAPFIDGPFGVVNADDFYGRPAFDALAAHFDHAAADEFVLVGYRLDGTLSPHGGVSRGVASADADGWMTALTEVHELRAAPGGVDGRWPEGPRVIPAGSAVSMNCWGFQPCLLPALAEGFAAFHSARGNEPKSEYLLPEAVMDGVRSGRWRVRVVTTDASWCGVTYPEDAPAVRQVLGGLAARGEYPVPAL